MDTYIILRKGPNGQYSSISAPMDKEKGDSWVALLKVRKPGRYLLLNWRTNIIEESNETTTRNAKGRSSTPRLRKNSCASVRR